MKYTLAQWRIWKYVISYTVSWSFSSFIQMSQLIKDCVSVFKQEKNILFAFEMAFPSGFGYHLLLITPQYSYSLEFTSKLQTI